MHGSVRGALGNWCPYRNQKKDRCVMKCVQSQNKLMTQIYWIYILKCSNGNYYTGYTTDLHRRYQEHSSGTIKCKYTRSFKPVSIAQSWQFSGSRSEAMKIEKSIKKLSRAEKENLILNPSFFQLR